MLYSYWWRGYDIDILSYCTVKKRRVKIRDKACYSYWWRGYDIVICERKNSP